MQVHGSEKIAELANHVIVCGAEESFHNFIEQLRRCDPLHPPVVILHPNLPKSWSVLHSMFQPLHFVQVTPPLPPPPGSTPGPPNTRCHAVMPGLCPLLPPFPPVPHACNFRHSSFAAGPPPSRPPAPVSLGILSLAPPTSNSRHSAFAAATPPHPPPPSTLPQ